jgi:hypothetical protein
VRVYADNAEMAHYCLAMNVNRKRMEIKKMNLTSVHMSIKRKLQRHMYVFRFRAPAISLNCLMLNGNRHKKLLSRLKFMFFEILVAEIKIKFRQFVDQLLSPCSSTTISLLKEREHKEMAKK